MKSIYISDDGKVSDKPTADEPPDVIYGDDGKMVSCSVRILLLMAMAKANTPTSEASDD